MVTPTYSPKTDPFEPTSLYVVSLDSMIVYSTMGSHVSGRGFGRSFIHTHAIQRGRGQKCGHGRGHEDASVGWGNSFISS